MKLDDGKIQYYSKSFIIGVLLYAYVASVYLFSYAEDYNMISNALMVVLCGAVLYYLMFKCRGGRVFFDKTLGFYSLFVCICIASVTYSVYKASAVSQTRTMVLIWIMFFVLYNYLVNTESDKLLIYALLIGGLIYSVYVIMYYGVSGYYELLISGVRVGAEITNVNTIGCISSTTFALCIYFAMFWKKPYLYIVSALPLITAFGSGSRKALASVVLALAIMIFLKYKSNKNLFSFFKMIFIIIVFAGVLWYILSLPAFETIMKRFEMFINSLTGKGKADNSSIVRENMIKYGFLEFKNHVFLGHGINNSKIVTMKYFGWSTYLHNNYVELLFDVGVAGTLAYYSMFAYLIKKLYTLFRQKTAYAEILLVLIIIRLVMDYGMVSYSSKETYILVIASAVFVKLHENKKEDTVNEQAVKSD